MNQEKEIYTIEYSADGINIFTDDKIKTKEDLFCFQDKLKLSFYSPIPDSEKKLLHEDLQANPDINIPRIFASVTLEKLTKDYLNKYLNPDTIQNLNDFKQSFVPYLNKDNTVKEQYITDEKLNFILIVSEFRREYSEKSLENDKKEGNYITESRSFKKNVSANFEQPKLLEENKSRLKKSNLLSKNKIHFLHPKAARELWNFMETKLKSLGIDCILLDADTLSLALKVYGRWGYYPIWTKDAYNKNNKNNLNLLLGTKSRVLFDNPNMNEKNKQKYRTCDLTHGPAMFKFLDKNKMPKPYSWALEGIQCATKNNTKSIPMNQYKSKVPSVYGTFLHNNKNNNWTSIISKKKAPYKSSFSRKKSSLIPKQGTYYQEHRRTYKRGQKK